LHLHILGAYYAEDVLELGKAVYQQGAWDEYHYADTYQALFGVRPDARAIFEEALNKGNEGLELIKRWHVYTEADGGDFARWEAKFNFFMGIWTRYRHIGGQADVTLLQHMIDRYWKQGLDYIEYRCGTGLDLENFLYFHSLCARLLQAASDEHRTARYILSLQRWAPLQAYANVQRLLAEYPELAPTIVGLDFASSEQGFPPKSVRPLFEQVARDNRRAPERALDMVYHVGEEFFDKSVESAIRWCHEIAEMGARRLGHALALGLDPDVATQRRPHAHVFERVSERLDQITYDLRHQAALRAYNVEIEEPALLAERAILQRMPPEEQVERPYAPARLDEIRRRQQLVLDRLTAWGTVIECCPTSNLRIGGVPDAKHHPIHRFLASNVNLVICSDDPGNFDITLASEIDWVLQQTGMSADALLQRLGDPRRFRLGRRGGETHGTDAQARLSL
jgi:adenosine deaminase